MFVYLFKRCFVFSSHTHIILSTHTYLCLLCFSPVVSVFRQFSHEVTSPDGDETPDSRYSTSSRLYENHSISSPTALLAAELTDDLMPLSEICKNHRLSISSSINTEHSQSPPPKSQSGGAPNSSFVRRSLRKIMKRGSVSTSALGGDEGLRNGSLKRRASNVSSSFFASAQERLRPRAKSLKKQRLVEICLL